MIYCYNERYDKQHCKFSSVLYSDLAHAHHHLLLKHTTNINIREHIQNFLLFFSLFGCRSYLNMSMNFTLTIFIIVHLHLLL